MHHFICSIKATVFIFFFFFSVYMSPYARNSFCRTRTLGYCYFSLLVNKIYTFFLWWMGQREKAIKKIPVGCCVWDAFILEIGACSWRIHSICAYTKTHAYGQRWLSFAFCIHYPYLLNAFFSSLSYLSIYLRNAIKIQWPLQCVLLHSHVQKMSS